MSNENRIDNFSRGFSYDGNIKLAYTDFFNHYNLQYLANILLNYCDIDINVTHNIIHRSLIQIRLEGPENK